MKRIQLFEFEDFAWFPSWIRKAMTNLIVVLHKMLGVSEVLAKLVAKVVRDKQLSTVVDLGSGSGGAMPQVVHLLHKNYGLTDTKLIMTDLYPDPGTVKKFNEGKEGWIRYCETPVDGTDIGEAPEGLKTMINSFHHMRPEEARKILESAARNGQTLLIYEMGKNNIPLIIWWLLLPVSLAILIIMVFFMTPFVKPLSWQQIIFTYLVPIIPICYAWDGQASLPRMYTLDDMKELLKGLELENYQWEMGDVKKENNKNLGTFVLGSPRSASGNQNKTAQ